jgi:ABC-type transport system substrate-binding protein
MWLVFGRRFLTWLERFVGHYEKVLLAILSVVIVISGSIWFRQFSANQEGPTVGGSLVEGMVGGDKELQQIAARLTKVGLFGFDSEGQLKNQLISGFSTNENKTEYRFSLINDLDNNQIVSDLALLADSANFADVKINDSNQLVISLSEPNPNLPLLLTQPIFNYGPYKLSKTTSGTAIFSRNTNSNSAKTYINKIVVHSYSDENALQEALNKGKIDTALVTDNLTAPDQFSYQEVTLPRYWAVLFNINKSPFRDPKFRTSVSEEKDIPKTQFILTVADQEPNKSLAQELINRWSKVGAQVTLEIKSADEIKTTIGPSRNFQALLTGIDYGPELDPYYLWHSTQVRPPGNNLTGINNDDIDNLLDQIRNSLDVAKRRELITTLHQRLQTEGVAIILKQETLNYLVSDRIRFQKPALANQAYDRFQAITEWSVK